MRSWLKISIVSPMLSPQVHTAKQKWPPAPAKRKLATNWRTNAGGCQPCTGKQKPIRSSSARSYGHFPGFTLFIATSLSPVASASA